MDIDHRSKPARTRERGCDASPCIVDHFTGFPDLSVVTAGEIRSCSTITTTGRQSSDKKAFFWYCSWTLPFTIGGFGLKAAYMRSPTQQLKHCSNCHTYGRNKPACSQIALQFVGLNVATIDTVHPHPRQACQSECYVTANRHAQICLDAWHIDCVTRWSNIVSQRQKGNFARNIYNVSTFTSRQDNRCYVSVHMHWL